MGWRKSDKGILQAKLAEMLAKASAEGARDRVGPSDFKTSEGFKFSSTLGENGAENFFHDLIHASAKVGKWSAIQFGPYTGSQHCVVDAEACGMIQRKLLQSGNCEIEITDLGVMYFAVYCGIYK